MKAIRNHAAISEACYLITEQNKLGKKGKLDTVFPKPSWVREEVAAGSTV